MSHVWAAYSPLAWGVSGRVTSMSFHQFAPLEALCNPQNDGAISDKQQLVLSKIAFAGAPAVVRCEVWMPKTKIHY